jgi:predicted transcriptional regulator
VNEGNKFTKLTPLTAKHNTEDFWSGEETLDSWLRERALDNMAASASKTYVVKERTPHWLMNAEISEYVEREESYGREKREDMERWERYKLTGRAVSHEAVDAWLSSWG